MNKTLMALLAASSAVIASVPAHAVTLFTGASTDTSYAMDFTPGAGAFTTTFDFSVAVAGVFAVSAQNIATSSLLAIDFDVPASNFEGTGFGETSAGGFERIYYPSPDGSVALLSPGTYSFTIVGTSGGPTAKYTLNAAFSPSAVPEPASWALMIAGFGVLGAAFRARTVRPKAANVAVSYA